MIKAFNGMNPKISPSAYVSEYAYVVGDVEIGDNSSIWPGAVIRGDMGKIIIGKETAVEDNCVIHSGSPGSSTQDLIIGDRVHIGHGAVINGRRIGNNVLIGMNATILHDAEIGDFCIIGANTLVVQGMIVPDNSLVLGVPGRIKGAPSEGQLYWIKKAHKEYTALAKIYKKEGI